MHLVRATRAIPSLTFDEKSSTFEPAHLRLAIEKGQYVYVGHEDPTWDWDPTPTDPTLPPVEIPPKLQENVMPGVSPQFLSGGTPGVSDVHSGFIRGPFPGTQVTDWAGLIRRGIDYFLGPGWGQPPGFTQGPGPLVLPPGSPTPGLFPPGGLTSFPGGGRGRVPFITMPNGLPGCPSGYHPMKDGQPFCVRNRRMNPLNPRALSRATRRVGGFARAVKRARTIKRVCKSL